MTAALGCGLLIALFYDIYWLFIACLRRPWQLRALQDMLFWLAAFCLVAALWLYFTGGVMRLYVYLWLAAGVFLFRRLCSRFLRRLRPAGAPPAAVLRPVQQNGRPKAAPVNVPPRLQKLSAWPAAAMLAAGRGSWLGAAWLRTWLAAHRPRKKEIPPGE